METIFDYQISKLEMNRILGRVWTREEYEKTITSINAAYVDLWRLFLLRGNPEKAKAYFDRIDNRFLKGVLMDLEWGVVGL